MDVNHIEIPHGKIADFCRRWKITEFALFGSVLTDDFGPDSDVDVLVEFTSAVSAATYTSLEPAPADGPPSALSGRELRTRISSFLC